ncbi:MAG TPA: cytochrome P450 [Ktedonobacteraceae bacterium]|jgi:cytochrome P450
MQSRTPTKLNLLALRRHYTDPHGLYDALRAQGGLAFDAGSQSWLATGHTIITKVLDTPLFLSGSGAASSSTAAPISSVNRQMLFLDGARHRRAQDVLLRPLALLVKSMPEIIRHYARQALDEARGRGEMEVVSQFAAPVSLLSIAHVLGMPQADREELQQLERWSDTFGDVTSGYFHGDMQDIARLEDYFRRLIAQKRRHPGADLLSAFLQATEVFPDEEDLVANCMMVFAAGRITTKKLLGNGIAQLLSQWQEIHHACQENPRFPRLLGEELLRRITPTRYLMRAAGQDIAPSTLYAGNPAIERGQRLLLFLEAANYDPAVFPQPEQLQLQRRPNKHLAFGYGPHQCPGATLARVEIQIALEEVLRLPALQTRPGSEPIWNPNPNLGGFTSHCVLLPGSL